ncbi:hypothetical protein GCM10011391_17390 [Pullulanibacillus camelliae]|uniref:DUF1657 domain-containing protein n=1 Tax=Pullulanibacillus camelliae TaxID=1707096 RepID=A0A8J2VS87_9BACL|nr:DUF1657 domain-containing protein [Pullulanibacillus camelliae]GGE39114.1 hypothetical protein GCM10011391_17390 [Pullulanibacillus camelliae]
MTVSQQLKQTIATLKSVQASLELFSYETKDKNTQSLFKQASQESDEVIASLETRLLQVQKEEPQFVSSPSSQGQSS